LVFVPGIGRRAGGANRWIAIAGLSIQPSDFAKVALILVLARVYSQAQAVDLRLSFTTLGLIILPAFLIAIEQDLGTAIHLVLVALSLLFFTRYPLTMQFAALGAAIATVTYVILKTPFSPQPHQGISRPVGGTLRRGLSARRVDESLSRGWSHRARAR
jgi:cell division protein FtsW